MKERKFLRIALLSFSFIVAASGLAFAGHDCTRQVVNSDGTIDVTTDCSSSRTLTQAPGAENFRDRYFFRTTEDDLLDSARLGMQGFEDRTGETFSAQTTDQIAADSREKQQEAIDAQRFKEREQETKLEDSKH